MGKLTLEPFECLEYMKEYIASHILPKRSLKYTTKSPCMFSSSLFFNCLTPYFYVKCSSLYVLCMYIVTIFWRRCITVHLFLTSLSSDSNSFSHCFTLYFFDHKINLCKMFISWYYWHVHCYQLWLLTKSFPPSSVTQ